MENSYAAVFSPSGSASREQGSDSADGRPVRDSALASTGTSANATRPGVLQPPRRGPSSSSFFPGRDDSDDVSGEPVDDPELETAASQVDVSTRCLCVSRDMIESSLPIIVSISMGAYFGVGVRMLLTEFVKAFDDRADGELLRLLGAGFFLPNVLGCLVMGIMARCKPLLRDRFAVYVTGVTTGFCGCCTTFASWDVGVAVAFVHGRWLTALVVIGVQVASAIASFRAGVQLAEGVILHLCRHHASFSKPPVDAKQLHLDLSRVVETVDAVRVHRFGEGVTRRWQATQRAITSSVEASKDLMQEVALDEQQQLPHSHKLFIWAIVAGILALWLWIPPFVGLGNYPSSRLFGLAVGPFGALLRYYLSLFNSRPTYKDFPLFTFIPNVGASILSCILLIIGSWAKDHSVDAFRTYTFVGDGGLAVGFCGSLSTVSTWVNELDSLASRSPYFAYRYAVGSVVVSQLASIFVLGLYNHYGSAPLIM